MRLTLRHVKAYHLILKSQFLSSVLPHYSFILHLICISNMDSQKLLGPASEETGELRDMPPARLPPNEADKTGSTTMAPVHVWHLIDSCLGGKKVNICYLDTSTNVRWFNTTSSSTLHGGRVLPTAIPPARTTPVYRLPLLLQVGPVGKTGSLEWNSVHHIRDKTSSIDDHRYSDFTHDSYCYRRRSDVFPGFEVAQIVFWWLGRYVFWRVSTENVD